MDVWISPTTRLVFLGTILPGAVILLTLLFDVLASLPWPKAFRRLGRKLCSPFKDFLTLDDLNSVPGPPQVPPAWKLRTLVVLSTLDAAGWAAVVTYGLLAGDVTGTKSVRGVVNLLAWVRPFSIASELNSTYPVFD